MWCANFIKVDLKGYVLFKSYYTKPLGLWEINGTDSNLFYLFQLDILLNGVLVDALSSVVHITKAATLGKHMCAKLVEIIPRQMIHVSLIFK